MTYLLLCKKKTISFSDWNKDHSISANRRQLATTRADRRSFKFSTPLRNYPPFIKHLLSGGEREGGGRGFNWFSRLSKTLIAKHEVRHVNFRSWYMYESIHCIMIWLVWKYLNSERWGDHRKNNKQARLTLRRSSGWIERDKHPNFKWNRLRDMVLLLMNIVNRGLLFKLLEVFFINWTPTKLINAVFLPLWALNNENMNAIQGIKIDVK